MPSGDASEGEATSRASSVVPNPLQHPEPPASESSGELRPEDAQGEDADADMDDVEERVVMTPAQLQDHLEVRFNNFVAESVPKLVKGMVTSLTERLKTLDMLASDVSGMHERTQAQEGKARERQEARRIHPSGAGRAAAAVRD